MSKLLFPPLLVALLACGPEAFAAVSAQEAAKLNNELTPLGAEKAGNKDGTIPAWTGGYTKPIPGDEPGGRRGDPFKDEKPLFSITPANVSQYADKLTDGTQALLKKYPESFRVNVYKTHRTAAAPQWVYDNTFKNATNGKMNGDIPQGVYGGIPFPIPQSGAELMWNHVLRWRGTSTSQMFKGYQLTANGDAVLVSDMVQNIEMPYYLPDSNLEELAKTNNYWRSRLDTTGPAIRAGEALAGIENLDGDKSQAWVYLVGQRRVRKLPNACCDTPSPATAGVMSFDEVTTFAGRLDRFDWKIIGKQEKYVPYNSNGALQVKDDKELLSKHHINPEHVRWELHRVWVVEATLRNGKRHQAVRSRYYCDEDSWICLLGDRWDANGQLWKTLHADAVVAPDAPAVVMTSFGFNDLISGTSFEAIINNKPKQYALTPRFDKDAFSADSLVGDSLR
ncbi:DUF1329 domain-containing protein [Pseudomonas baetica]|uniref:DUF1329 domain-containing protein n=1 Tax=Pseudomonas baetica TaxID=674054 RepID=UPI003EEFE749